MTASFSRRSLMGAGAIGLAAFAVPGLTSCSTSSESPGPKGAKPVTGGSLRVGLTGGGSTESLDPHFQFLAPDLVRSFALYAYLGEHDGQAKPSPLLAESVEPSDAKATTWDIRLRKGLEFHNGKTVSSDDLIFSLRRMLDPAMQSSGALLLPWVDAQSLKTMDERTVRVTLDRSVSIFDEALFNFLTTVLPVDFDPANPVGAGPFKFDSFTPGDRSVFTRFDNYFAGSSYVDQLEVITFNDDTAQINALLGSEIDIAGGLSPAGAAVGEQSGITVVTTPSMGWQPLTMRMDVAPFDDPQVRAAFRLIADRDQIVEQTYSGRGAARNDMYGWDSDGYLADVDQRAQDLEEARALLEAAGLTDLTIDLQTTPALPGQVEICQVFAEQAKAAGVTVNVNKSTPDVYYAKHYLSAEFATDTFANVPYLNNTLQCQLSTSPYNATHWSDDEFNALYDKALSTTDAAARAAVIEDMQRIQYERGSLLIAASFDGLDATSTQVNGLRSNESWAFPMNGYHLERVWLS